MASETSLRAIYNIHAGRRCGSQGGEGIVGSSQMSNRVLVQIRAIAPADCTVLIEGA
jgi:DNA-binding NtrC family response regulator